MSAIRNLSNDLNRETRSVLEGVDASENSGELSLLEQRLACRAQLAKQRKAIAFQLGPKQELTHEAGDATNYPRSMTMRFLTQNPAPAVKLLVKLATMLIGARASGVLNTGFQTYKMFRASKNLFR